MAVADSVYRGYVSYRQRITDRLIPVFVLEPRPDTSSDGSGQAPVV
jgi:hypothetical protein